MTKNNLMLDDQVLERHRVRRVPLGENLVFHFEADEPTSNGKLSCTLLFEGDVGDESFLNRSIDISRQIYIRVPSNQIIRANQISASLLNGVGSPVQRLVFDTEGEVPISIGCDDPTLMLEVYFPFDVLRALSDDLGARAPLLDIAF